MATGGLTFGATKDTLRLFVENGVSSSDPRVIRRTNQAIQELLLELIPVNGMMTADYVVTGEQILLVKEQENAISVEVIGDAPPGTERGWFNIVNNFTYVDPSMAKDNPLEDQFLQPDPSDPTILRRQYRYPGVPDGTILRVTGAKRYVPITDDSDYLIIQNVPAITVMLQAIERRNDRNGLEDSKLYKAEAVDMLAKEARKHLLDPQNAMSRKASYEKDLRTFAAGTLGNTRARLALELPPETWMQLGQNDLTRLVNEAVREAVDHYNFLGRTERYSLDEGPNQITFTQAQLAGDILSYGNFEVIRLLALAQRTPPPAVLPPQDATPAKQQAFSLIERNLQTQVDSLRTATYLALSKNSTFGSKGWMVGRIGIEMPEAIVYPPSRLRTLIDRAEERLMSMGMYKGSLEEFDAKVVCGNLFMPARVESILAASLDGIPIEIRSIFFKYSKTGPGAWDYSCGGRLDDLGDIVLKDGARRRRYRIYANSSSSTTQTNIGSSQSGGGVSGDFGGGTIIDGIFYFDGGNSRLVPITGGLAIEVKDGSGNWIKQGEITE